MKPIKAWALVTPGGSWIGERYGKMNIYKMRGAACDDNILHLGDKAKVVRVEIREIERAK